MIGDRTRAALEREKMLALRTLKELEFDRSMRKISEEDFQRDVGAPARARDAHHPAAGRGRRIPREDRGGSREAPGRERLDQTPSRAPQATTCAACQTVNDADAKFCKSCGTKL